MVANKILHDTDERMKKQIEAVRRELSGIRTGKASPALLDTIKVEAYGTMTPLNQVGSVSAPEPRLLVIQPWDKGLVRAISKAIQSSDLGLNPVDDGTVVRVPIPSMTEERRKDIVKAVAKLAEEGRVHVRQVRHDVNKDVKHQETEGTIAQDESKRLVAEVQKLTDHAIAQIDELLKKKTAEVMEV
jgi:ribosome recycling factor